MGGPALRDVNYKFHSSAPFASVTNGLRFDALIADFQQRRPGERAVLSSAIDIQGNVFRYVGVVEGSATARGGEAFDAGACDEDGRIRLLLTFVGAALPART